MIGRTLDHYRIESKLGKGGMGVVYRARDIHLNRPVAIKVLPAERVADPGRKRRFVQEAKSASALNHPNIITIYEIRSIDGIDFIAMEYVEGKTLNELIPPKGLQSRQAVRYGVQIADALAKVHGAGILHRDLKPSNIMVTDEGRVKILDFGLAKLLEPADAAPDGTTLTARPLTEDGALLGTVAYMSPEQVEGHKLDTRSDIFSLGIILYEMVTGERPFSADSRLTLMTKVVNDEPQPPSQLVSSISPDLEKIILRCLQKAPARRFQDMADLKVALELEAESTAGSKSQTEVTRSASRWRWVWAALLPVLLAAGFFVWREWRPEPANPLQAVALTTLPGEELYPSFSPDGNHVAFTWNGPNRDNPDIYVQQIGSGSPLRLTSNPSSDHNPVWSPDGRWIAFLRSESPSLTSQGGKTELRLIPPLGGPERKVTDIRTGGIYFAPLKYLAWTPDSNSLVVMASQGERKPEALFAVPIESGEKRQLTYPELPVLADLNPAVAPDSSSLVFRRDNSFGAQALYWLPVGKGLTADGEPKRVPNSSPVGSLTWMPNGKEILFSSAGALWRLPMAPGGSEPTRVPFVGEDGYMPVVSRLQSNRPSRLVYVRGFRDENIWRLDISGPETAPLSAPVVGLSSTRLERNPQFSSDGRRVAFESNRSGSWEVWLSDSVGSNIVQLTSMGASFTSVPRWSPDGQSIALQSNLEGQFEIYVVPAGGGKPRRITFNPANDQIPSFSKDGKWIYFTSNRNGEFQIWKTPVAGGEAVQVTPNRGYAAFEALNGDVFYTETPAATSALWRLPPGGLQPTKVLDGVVWRAFALVEKGIYYIDMPAVEARLHFFDFRTRNSRMIGRNLGESSVGLTVSPDGRAILYSRVDSSGSDLMLVENIR